MTTTIKRGHPATRRALGRLRAKLAERRRQREMRDEFRTLLTMDDHILTDIGLGRGDIAYLARLPLSQDAEKVMRELGYRVAA